MNGEINSNFSLAKFNPEAFNIGSSDNSFLPDTLSTSNIPSQIFSYLDDISDIFNLQLVCKRFYNAANEIDVLLGKNQWERISSSFEDLNIHTKKAFVFSFLDKGEKKYAFANNSEKLQKLRQRFITPINDSFKINDIFQIKKINCQLDKVRLAFLEFISLQPENLDDLFAIDLDQVFSMALKGNSSLHLYNFLLTSLPSQIKGFNNLTELYLADNLLEFLPEQISSLTKLINIDVSNNRFYSFPKVLFKMSSLQTLSYVSNYLKSLPVEFCSLTNLKTLDLSYNNLTSLPEEFCNLRNLEVLQLNSNHLSSLPIEFDKLSSLTYLNLNINDLNSVPTAIGNLCNLSVLALSNNNLKTLPRELLNLTNLKILHIGQNNLKVIPIEFFDGKDEIIYNANPLDLDCRKVIAEKTGGFLDFCIQTLLYNTPIIFDRFQSIDFSLDYSFIGTKF